MKGEWAVYIGAKAVEPLPDYRLLITFEFNSARVCSDTVEWSNGADICPETL
jgi:hypothetical protein